MNKARKILNINVGKHIVGLLLLITTSIIGYIIYQASLNYHGYCNTYRLTTSDKIKIIIDHIERRNTVPIEVSHPNLKATEVRYYKYIPYKDVGDFLEKNPDCCSIIQSSNNGTYDFLAKATGIHSDEISVTYIAHFLDENNQRKTHKKKWRHSINNCGVITD